ncbi:Flagellin N-methylase [Planctomycetes bacterium Poly30]|uniref:Flagellin N-methylase n=1 Tax=Saltatorellus ferox TaxID=2528018 RepID=A0A518EW70_9BACT|nr:Flagellin N-methylase [Planctomycetes bacterium Poly30]
MSDEGASHLHPCARCAKMQRTCCQSTEIFVTLGDVRRIGEHAPGVTFHESRRPLDPEYLGRDDDDPIWAEATVRPGGLRRVLKKTETGDCVFLGEAGCRLPEDVRPIVCRIYPFSFNEDGIDGEDPEYCPTSVLAPVGTNMSTVLGMSRARAESWRKQLYAELREELATR